MTPRDRIAEIRACAYATGDCFCGLEDDQHDVIQELLAALDDRDREIERLRAELSEALDNADVSHRKAHRFSLERDAAYRAGAEAMREACAATCAPHHASLIRALPVPEPKR